MKKGHIFFISWVAWAWKWTAIKWLLKEAIPNLELALSCKTREPRKWEILWVDYNKLSVEEFKSAIENWEFLEYNFIHNQAYYWTRMSDVIDNWINKWKIIIKEMDILILPKVLEERSNLREDFTYIFIDLPIESIRERMMHRWDDVTWLDYENRINSALKEKNLKHLADHIIDWSWKPEDTLEQLKNIIFNKINKL